jgi:hypothetical protein
MNYTDNNNRKSNAIKFAGLLCLAVIIVGVGFYFKDNGSTTDYQSLPSDIKVNVTDAGGQMPEVKSTENTKGTSEQPAQNPSDAATVEQLGGDSNNPAGIDALLEGKDIEIKK